MIKSLLTVTRAAELLAGDILKLVSPIPKQAKLHTKNCQLYKLFMSWEREKAKININCQ